MRIICWLFGCIHEEEIGGGWCSCCKADYKDQYKPLWVRLMRGEETSK